MDVESVSAELLELVPSRFTAVRDEYVAQARKAGDRELAARIGALRKPTLAVWTAGLLARSRPKEARGLVELGEALRTAHQTLDAAQLRKLSHDQHAVVGRLARTAGALAAEAGQAVSEAVLREVEQILHAVLADAEVAAQWVAGRLVKAPDAVMGFDGLELLPGAAPPSRTKARPSGPATERVPRPAPDAGAEQARRERAKAVQEEAAEALAEAGRMEAGQVAAQELVDRTTAAVKAAEDEVRAATERLEMARTASAEAAARHREAGRAAKKAQARAEAAARKAGKPPTSPTPPEPA
ncbi:hypothetical protein ACTVZO_00810 [Streptomyces sp. IBSNAI002]|uniref:hypothetical protein n=1 Tax=Streptomyces sp. IBSNAI002 TaxID=3457500 RepID=UPI003FD0BB6C